MPQEKYNVFLSDGMCFVSLFLKEFYSSRYTDLCNKFCLINIQWCIWDVFKGTNWWTSETHTKMKKKGKDTSLENKGW